MRLRRMLGEFFLCVCVCVIHIIMLDDVLCPYY